MSTTNEFKNKISSHTYSCLKEEASQRLSSLYTGKKMSEEFCERRKEYMLKSNPFKGKHHSEESKKLMSEQRKKRITTKETRSKMSIAHKGEHSAWYGKKLSQYHINKRTKSRIGKYLGVNNPKSKKILCIETNIVYNAIAEAGRLLKLNPANSHIALKDLDRTWGGFHWRYY